MNGFGYYGVISHVAPKNGRVISIRPARPDDSADIHLWRNDPQTREASVHTAEVPLSDHEAWLSQVLASSASLYMAEDHDGEPIGVVRFDPEGAAAEVSINLAPAFRGLGLGLPVLSGAIDEYERVEGHRPLLATIRTWNTASVRLFEAVGFVLASSDGEFLSFRRDA